MNQNPIYHTVTLKHHEQENDRYNCRENDPQVPRQLRQARHRRPLKEHLPREINRPEAAENNCPGCGSEMKYLIEVNAEQLELVSCALKVIRTVRVKKKRVRCDCIVEAPAPSRPIVLDNNAAERVQLALCSGKTSMGYRRTIPRMLIGAGSLKSLTRETRPRNRQCSTHVILTRQLT